jgi:nucleotide-binding universal stress UspA family protein
MIDRLLVPTDGSGPATAALELALKTAPSLATVYVLYVAELDAPGGGPDDPGSILAAARERTAKTGTSVVTKVREGDPRACILAAAAEHDIDLVAMGSHGRRGTAPLVLGRVTEAVVHDAPAPVLVVRASDDIPHVYPYRRILVPTDGSECANIALDLAIEMAAETGATIDLLSVVFATEIGADEETDRLIDRLVDNAALRLESLAERATARGVEVRMAVEVGAVHDEITEYAEAADVDLLVMGTHGRSGEPRALLGSVTERVLRTAPAPVLTVRADESTADGR